MKQNETSDKKSLFLLLGIVMLAFGVGYYFKDVLTYKNLLTHYTSLKSYLTAHFWWSSLLFFVAYALSVAISLPGALLMTLLGGLLFGGIYGGILVITAATVGASMIFLLARNLLKPYFEAKIAAYITQFKQGFEKNAFSYLLFLRLTPIFPFWLVNIAPAFMNISLQSFATATLIGIAPASFIFTHLASGLISVVELDALKLVSCADSSCIPQFNLQNLLSKEIIFALFALGILSLLPIFLKRGKPA